MGVGSNMRAAIPTWARSAAMGWPVRSARRRRRPRKRAKGRLTGLRRGRALLAQAIPQATAAMLDQRVIWFKDSVVFALARWVRDTPAPARTSATLSDLLEHLVAYGAAGLAVPRNPQFRS